MILLPLLISFLTTTTHSLNIDELMQLRTTRPPTGNENRPLDVRLGMYLESLGNFRSTEMSFDVDLYVYMSWRDDRLKHNRTDYVLVNDDEVRKKIWLPDLYFANARSAHFQEVTVPNFNMFIAKDGTVAYSCRCTLTVACSLDLRFYPMDAQICSIRVLSYAHIAKQLNVSWFDINPIRHNPEIGLPEFHITDVTKGYCNGTYRYALMPGSFKMDDFSCLAGQLYLARSIGYNLVQSYIPTGLIVMISWVSFWIDRRAVPARVTLSFTTLVSLTTLGNGLRFGLPQVSYAKAIDLWYGVCMLFVFMALLEFAIINSYMRKSEKFEHLSRRIQEAALIRRDSVCNLADPVLDCSRLNGKKPSPSPPINGSLPYIDDLSARKKTPNTFRLLKKSTSKPTREPIRFINNEYAMTTLSHRGENGGMMESVDSGAQSIYDNVSPWKDIRKTLLSDDSSKNSEDELWSSAGDARQTRVVYEVNGNDRISDTDISTTSTEYLRMSRCYSRRALWIDQMCRYGFPLIFLTWNIWYWWYYLVFNSPEEHPYSNQK